jgi:hypothetical protein
MTGRRRTTLRQQIPLGEVEIGPAHSTRLDTDQELSANWCGHLAVDPPERVCID